MSASVLAYTPDPPKRSDEQRKKALELANYTRGKRAQLKRDIKAGVVDPYEVLIDPPDYAHGMYVIDVLLAMRAVGRTKATGVLMMTNSSPHKTVGGLSARQRNQISQYVDGRRDRRR